MAAAVCIAAKQNMNVTWGAKTFKSLLFTNQSSDQAWWRFLKLLLRDKDKFVKSVDNNKV